VISVDVLSPGDGAEYDEFVRGHPAALVYHSSAYRDFLKELLACEEQYLVARVDGRIEGVLPLLWTSSAPLGRVYNSLPYFGSTGGILAATSAAADALATAYGELATAEATCAATVVENPFAGPTPTLPHTHVDRRLAQFTRLPSCAARPEDELLAAVEPSARRNVRKALANGISVENDPSAIGRLRALHELNMGELGGPAKSGAFFDLVTRRLEPARDFDLYVARKDGAMVAGLLVWYFNRTVEYVVPAIDPAFRSDQPLAAILFTAMTAAASRGFERWNWGGTHLGMRTLYRFKRKWAAEAREYRYLVHVAEPRVLEHTPDELSASFGHFYVVPFSSLAPRAAAHG
jgi:hypothetical protein